MSYRSGIFVIVIVALVAIAGLVMSFLRGDEGAQEGDTLIDGERNLVGEGWYPKLQPALLRPASPLGSPVGKRTTKPIPLSANLVSSCQQSYGLLANPFELFCSPPDVDVFNGRVIIGDGSRRTPQDVITVHNAIADMFHSFCGRLLRLDDIIDDTAVTGSLTDENTIIVGTFESNLKIRNVFGYSRLAFDRYVHGPTLIYRRCPHALIIITGQTDTDILEAGRRFYSVALGRPAYW